MFMKAPTYRLIAIVTLVLSSALLAATIPDGKTAPEDQAQTQAAPMPQTAAVQQPSRLPHGQQHGAAEAPGHHSHDRWESPPPAYASLRSSLWADAAAIARGKQLFQTYCTVCHGADGRGTGPAAKGLPHPPADLTTNFHTAPGDGDAYLFWRVSEGGTVEPFKAMQSAMPAFKNLLSAEQRWQVLAYVHTYFHLGLAKWQSKVQDTPERP
jgi:mono/diheme cytochrome c family protein